MEGTRCLVSNDFILFFITQNKLCQVDSDQ